MSIKSYLSVGFAFLVLLSASTVLGEVLTQAVYFSAPQIKNLGNGYNSISIESCSQGGEVGGPEVPCKAICLLLPYGKSITGISVTASETAYLGKYKLIPLQEQTPIDKPVSRTKPKADIYSSTVPYPRKYYINCGVSGYRGYSYQIIVLYPISCIPATNSVGYISKFDIVIELEDSKECGWMTPKEEDLEMARYYSYNKDIADSYFDNAKVHAKRTLPSATFRYVLITNEDFTYYFQPLVEHKQSRTDWISATMVSTSWIYSNYSGADDQIKVRNFIKDAVASWGTRFVLLGGDGSVVPVRQFKLNYNSQTDVPQFSDADVYYGALDVSWDSNSDGIYGEEPTPQTYEEDLANHDFEYDVNVGRCLVAEDDFDGVTSFVNKVIEYENSDYSYLNKAVFATGRAGPGQDQNWVDEIRAYSDDIIDQYTYYYTSFNETTLYSGLYGTTPFHDEFTDLLNNNLIHIFNYCGHGGSLDGMAEGAYETWENSYYYFAYSASCGAGAYNTVDDGLVLVQSLTDPNGIFAFVGESGEALSQTFSYCNKFWHTWLADNYSALGEMLSIGKKSAVMELVGSSYGCHVSYYRLNLLGDPETRLHICPAIPSKCIVESGDYNGDGTSEIAVFRPNIGKWIVKDLTKIYFGTYQDIPACGNYDGDSDTDIGIFRNSTGNWKIRNITNVYFGNTGDIPIPGDYNGNGTCNIGIFRGSNGLWAIRGLTQFYYGQAGDVPIPGDYNGDGTTDIAVFRNGASPTWRIRGGATTYFGITNDIPIPHDAGGNGTTDMCIYRPSSGRWRVRNLTTFFFGLNSDRLVPGDYDGDGDDDTTIFRATDGKWFIRNSTTYWFGSFGDIPASR